MVIKIVGTSQTIKNYIKGGRVNEEKIVKLKTGAYIQLREREIHEERYIFFVGADLEKSNVFPLLESANRLKKMCEELDRKTLHIACVEKTDLTLIRKVIGHAFWDFEGQLIWHNVENRRKVKPDTKRDDAVIIDAGEGTYADLLKTVKTSMEKTKEADIIKNTSRTRNGNLKLTIDSKRGTAVEVANYLKNKVGPSNVRAVGSINARKVLHLYGMDELITEDDVRKEIVRHASCAEADVVVRNLKPLRIGGLQMTTVVSAQKYVDKVAALGEIRIGLSYCKIKVRPDLLTCFRCWKQAILRLNVRAQIVVNSVVIVERMVIKQEAALKTPAVQYVTPADIEQIRWRALNTYSTKKIHNSSGRTYPTRQLTTKRTRETLQQPKNEKTPRKHQNKSQTHNDLAGKMQPGAESPEKKEAQEPLNQGVMQID